LGSGAGAGAFSFSKTAAVGGSGGKGEDGADGEGALPKEEQTVAEKAKDTIEREVKYEVRAKLSRLGDEVGTDGKQTGKKEWKAVATGQLQLLYSTTGDNKRYLLLRDEKQLGKLRLNMLIQSSTTFKTSGTNIQFPAVLDEPARDPETGKMDHDKMVRVIVWMNIKTPKDDVEEAFKHLTEAIPPKE